MPGRATFSNYNIEHGSTVLAVGAGSGCEGVFPPVQTLREAVRYRLKYCFKAH